MNKKEHLVPWVAVIENLGLRRTSSTPHDVDQLVESLVGGEKLIEAANLFLNRESGANFIGEMFAMFRPLVVAKHAISTLENTNDPSLQDRATELLFFTANEHTLPSLANLYLAGDSFMRSKLSAIFDRLIEIGKIEEEQLSQVIKPRTI